MAPGPKDGASRKYVVNYDKLGVPGLSAHGEQITIIRGLIIRGLIIFLSS